MECIICDRCGAHINYDDDCECLWTDQIEMELRSSRKPVTASYGLDSYGLDSYGKEATNDYVW